MVSIASLLVYKPQNRGKSMERILFVFGFANSVGTFVGGKTCDEGGWKVFEEFLVAKILHGFCGVGVDGLVRD